MRTIAEREFNLQLFAEGEGEAQAPAQTQGTEAPAQQGGYEGILNLPATQQGGEDWRAQLPDELSLTHRCSFNSLQTCSSLT